MKLLKLWLWLGIKMGWKYIDVKHYSNNKDLIEAITFSTSKSYINKISKIK